MLGGLLVVDLSRHLPGPLAARLLRDLGARVVKVEEPELGDPLRGAPPLRDGRSSLAALLLPGIESVALDLKKPAARELLAGLLARADVLLESFRPGTLERLGLAPTELRRAYPRLVLCSISGFGKSGPWAARAGHDLTYQALGGTLAATARMPGVPVADLVGAWSAVTAILAALVRRERSGEGAQIDAALLDAAVAGNAIAWAAEAGGERRVGERHDLAGALPCYNLYRARDGGWIALACLEPHFWKRFCRAVGRRDLIRRQFRRDPESEREIADLIRARTRQEWSELFSRHDLPGEAVLSPSEAARHPQIAAREILSRGEDSFLRLGFPALIDGVRPRAGKGFPELGEQTEDLISELGHIVARLPRWRRRRLGIGRRWSLRRILWRLVSG